MNKFIMSSRYFYKFLTAVLIMAALTSCKVYWYDVNAIRESNTKQEAAFTSSVALLNESLFKATASRQLCDFKIVLELIAHTKSDYEKIVVDDVTAAEIAHFLDDGYLKIKSGKVSSYTIKSMEDKLNHILHKLFETGKQNSNKVNKTVFEGIQEIFCPLDPFC